MSIEYRFLTPSEAGLLARVADDVFDGPIDPSRLAVYLAEPGHILIVALDGDLVVGQAAAVIYRHPDQPTELYIDNLGVAPDWHRRGIARQLIERMLARGRVLGCEEAWVATEPGNGPARALYRGFAPEAETFVMYEWEL